MFAELNALLGVSVEKPEEVRKKRQARREASAEGRGPRGSSLFAGGQRCPAIAIAAGTGSPPSFPPAAARRVLLLLLLLLLSVGAVCSAGKEQTWPPPFRGLARPRGCLGCTRDAHRGCWLQPSARPPPPCGVCLLASQQPREGKLTLLCATKTDADFLTHHFLSFYLKAGCRVCFVALVQSFSHYSIVAQKLGISLPAAKDRGQLVFLEGLKSSCEVLFSEERQSAGPNPFQFISGDGSSLKPLYEFVRTALSPAAGEDSWKCPVLIVDNLSVLLSLGLRPVDVLDFLHYCRVAVISQLKGNIVVMAHSSDDSEDEESELLVRALRHQSNRILWAEGLATGFCKDIHGQVVMCPLLKKPSLDSTILDNYQPVSNLPFLGKLRIIQRSSWEKRAERDLVHTFQYKVQDKNVTFFARGMSAAVL